MAIDWYALAKSQGFADPKAFLEHLYYKQGLSGEQAAIRIGCSHSSFLYAARRFGLKLREHGGPRFKGKKVMTMPSLNNKEK